MRASIGPPALLFFLLLSAGAPAPASAASAVVAAAGDPTVSQPGCELEEPTYDSKRIRCVLPPAAAPRRYRLQIDFAGGHDDTVARITAATLGTASPGAAPLGAAPLACELPGSKTELQGEDGNVSLYCFLSIPAGTTRPPSWAVVDVRWSHAQYVGYSFLPAP